MDMTLSYNLQAGSLPPGLDVKDAMIDGLVLWANGGAPVWDTNQASFLGNFNDNANVNLPALIATAAEGRTLTSFQIVGRMDKPYTSLPFGTVMDWETGTITGVITPTGEVSANPWLPGEQPIWSNDAGQLADSVKYQTIATITLSATPQHGTAISSYFITKGSLPFGLKLNTQTGTITGTISDSNILDGYVSPTPEPTWTTIPGLLGNVGEKQAVTISLSATANLGTGISSYFITSGSLPFGLVLNSTTGVISGTTSELLTTPLEPEYHYPGPDWVTDGDLGSTAVNSAYSVTLASNPPEARTISGYYVVNGGTGQLPRGVWLNYSTGVVSGTPRDTGSYTFIVNAVDSSGNYTSRAFTLVVTE